MKPIEVELSKEGLNELKTYYTKVQTSLCSEEFMKFIAKKANETLLQVQAEKLTTADEGIDEEYRRNHKYHIGEDEIVLFNKTIIPQSNLDEDFRENYPNGFNLSKAVEYGVGYTGAKSEASKYAKDWQYDKNNHGFRGWYYKDSNGNKVWTNGYSGRLIYFTTKQRIDKNINSWINEYIENIK